jgi:hypothetical protein
MNEVRALECARIEKGMAKILTSRVVAHRPRLPVPTLTHRVIKLDREPDGVSTDLIQVDADLDCVAFQKVRDKSVYEAEGSSAVARIRGIIDSIGSGGMHQAYSNPRVCRTTPECQRSHPRGAANRVA